MSKQGGDQNEDFKRKGSGWLSGLLHSFLYALNGIRTAIIYERNFRIHLSVAGLCFIFAKILCFELSEYFILLLCICLVLVAELFNTAIETLANEFTLKYNKNIGVVKDLSAAAVFITAISAAICGIYLFFIKNARLLLLKSFFGERPFILLLIILLILALIYFISGKIFKKG